MESIVFIGTVHSPLRELKQCPLQESEGAPSVSVTIGKDYSAALKGIEVGMEIHLITWLHKGDRSTLFTRPRNDPDANLLGVFATRSPDRPNPIGLHKATVTAIDLSGTLALSNLEVLDGTPVIDIKPVI